MQCAKYMVSTSCEGSAVVTMQAEGSLRAGTGHSVWDVACACHSGTPPLPAREPAEEPLRKSLPAQEPPPFLNGNPPS